MSQPNFLYDLGARVVFPGDQSGSIGKILGRMEDSNGKHYEVEYSTPNSTSKRRWFNEHDISLLVGT